MYVGILTLGLDATALLRGANFSEFRNSMAQSINVNFGGENIHDRKSQVALAVNGGPRNVVVALTNESLSDFVL
jgi:hypothetical protein